jgi:hypothetical protein
MTRDKTLLSIAMMVGAGALLIVMPDAGATAQRTFVASTGLETNACSLTQPCRSFGRAITQTNDGGEIIVLDTIVRDNLDSGIYVGAANGSALLDHVRSEHNVFEGFHITQGANATIVDSVFTHNLRNGIMALTVAGAMTSVQLERSILSNNGGEGFGTTVGAVAFAVVRATLRRNAISGNGGDGVLISAVTPGVARGFLLDNSVHESGGIGIHANGLGVQIKASANSAQSSATNTDMFCENGAFFLSFGNNMGETLNTANCAFATGGSF